MNEKDENKPKTFQEIINQGSSSNSFSSPSTSKTTSFVDILRGKVTSPTVVPKQVPVTPITTTPSKPKDDSLYKTAQLSIGQSITTGVTTGIKGLNEYSNWFYKKFNKGKDVFGKDSDTQTKLLDEDVKKFEQKIQQGVLDTIGEDRMNSYLYQAGSGIGQGVVQLAAFAVNPIAGLSVIAGQTISAGKQAYDDAYAGMIKNGATEEEAKRVANINGNIVGTVNSLEALAPARAFRMLGIGNLLKKPLSNSTKAILGRIAKEGLIESSTEAFQEAVQSETARRTWNKEAGVQDTIQDAIASFLVSIPSGILFGGAGEIQLRKNHLDKAELQVKELLQTEAGLDENESKTVAEFIVDNYAITATQDLFSDEERAGIEEFARNEKMIEEGNVQQEQPAFQKKSDTGITIDTTSQSEFDIGGETYEGNKIVKNGEEIGFVALEGDEIVGIEISEKQRGKGLGTEVVSKLLEDKNSYYIRSTPEALPFWKKVGITNVKENKDSGLFEGYITRESFNKTNPSKKIAKPVVKTKSVDPETRKKMIDVIDYLRLNKIPKGKTEKTIEDDVSKLSELFGINQYKPSSFIANKLTTILETKPEGDLDVENPDVPMFQKKATEKAKEDFNQNPKVFTTQLFEDKQLWEKETQKKQTIINALNKLRKPIMKDYAMAKLETEFANSDVINMEDFKSSLMRDLLEVSIIESDTYANYGLENINYDYRSDEVKTYIINTNFEHGVTGHFSNNFDIKTTKDDIEIRESKGKFYVVRKDLSSSNLESGVFQLFNTRKEAENYIENFEERKTSQKGMMAHYRAVNDTDMDTFVVLEMQSDVFQKDTTSLIRDNEQLKKVEIEKIKEREVKNLKEQEDLIAQQESKLKIVEQFQKRIDIFEKKEFKNEAEMEREKLQLSFDLKNIYTSLEKLMLQEEKYLKQSIEDAKTTKKGNTYKIDIDNVFKQNPDLRSIKELKESFEKMKKRYELGIEDIKEEARKEIKEIENQGKGLYFRGTAKKEAQLKLDRVERIIDDKETYITLLNQVEQGQSNVTNGYLSEVLNYIKEVFKGTEETFTFINTDGRETTKLISTDREDGMITSTEYIYALISGGMGSQSQKDKNFKEFESIRKRTIERVNKLEKEFDQMKSDFDNFDKNFEITQKQKSEIERSKQFLSLKNKNHEQIINHSIREAAKKGRDKIRFPTPMTVSYIEGYTQESSTEFGMESGLSAEDIENIGVGGEVETNLGTGVIIGIEADQFEFAYPDYGDSSDYRIVSETDIISDENNALLEDFEDRFDVDEIVFYLYDERKINIEQRKNIEDLSKNSGDVLKEVEKLGIDIDSLKNEVVSERMKDFDVSEYMEDLYEDLASFEKDGETNYVIPINGGMNIEFLAYKREVNKEDFDLDELSNEHKAIASKYGVDKQGKKGEFYKYLEKRLPDLKEVTDDNGFTWWEANITEKDTAAVELFQRSEKQEKLIPAREGVAILKEASQRLGVRFPIAIYRTILTGEVMKDGSLGEAYGMYLDKKISLSQFITATTAQHELGHLLFRNMEDIPLFKGISREKLYLELRAYKKEWNNLSNYELEEKFMELIEQYSIDIQSGKVKKPKTGLQKLVADVYNALRKMLGLSTAEVSSMQKFMDTMYFGKSNEVVTLYDSNKTSDFMEARFKEFGQELKEIPVFQKKGKKATTQEVEEFIKVATQRTTNGRKTAQQIKKELFPKKDTLTIAEQNLIKKRLKQQEKGYIKGIVSGKKIGKEQQIQKQIPITRKQELNSLRENIQRRLYRKTLIEELRKLPRSEWKTLGTDIANVNLSEAKYLNTLSKITNRIAELEIANGERKVLALSRRDIGFLRHIYDINQPLINSIKKSLNIRDTYKTGERAGQFKEELKQIKDYTLEELNMFKAELKKRIEFRQQNPVRYFDHVELKEPTVKDMVKDFAGKVIDTMERTLRNINPAIEQRMNTYYFDVNRAKKDRLSKVEPFIKLYYKASKENQYLIKKAALNGEMDKLKTLMETVSGTDPSVTLKEIRTVMDGLHRELVSVGLEVNYLENYFPRLLKPVTKDRAEILVAQLEFKEGRKATSEEREKIITNLTRGFNFVQNPFVTLSGKQFEAERLIENIDDSNADMYEDPATALIQYISAATNVVEQRRLFGKNVVEGADYDSFLGNSITKMVYDYYEQGLIKQKDINKLQEVFNTLFVSNISPNHRYLQKITSKYIYPLTLGQITSTINQVKDLAMQVLKNDIFAGQWNTFRTFGLTPESIGLSDSIMQLEGLAETKDNNAFSRFLEKSMTPFGKTDNFFLKVAVNSIYLKLTKLSKEKNNQKFVKDLENVFGNRAMEVLAELQSKTGNETTVSKDIQRLIWGEIASFRPISDLQKAAYAKKKPMFYVLRNFMIKQLEFVRSESFDIIADGYKKKDAKRTAEGMARLLTLMVVIGGVGAGVDEAKDWILGKKDQKFMDKVAENIMNIVGLNNYMINVGKQRGFAAQLLTSYTPAALSIGGQIADDLRSDIIKIKEGEAEKVKSYRRFPLIGNLVYQRYGGGNK